MNRATWLRTIQEQNIQVSAGQLAPIDQGGSDFLIAINAQAGCARRRSSAISC